MHRPEDLKVITEWRRHVENLRVLNRKAESLHIVLLMANGMVLQSAQIKVEGGKWTDENFRIVQESFKKSKLYPESIQRRRRELYDDVHMKPFMIHTDMLDDTQLILAVSEAARRYKVRDAAAV